MVRGSRRADYSARRCVTLKHQRQPVYSRKYKASTSQSYSQSSHNNSLSETHYNGSECYLPPLIPDPLAPPTSIDSPPRHYSATLPPPRTRTHAASTQTLHPARRRRRHHLSISSSARTSAKSTPKHHVSTSTSPITLDPASLKEPRERVLPQTSLTTCQVPPCSSQPGPRTCQADNCQAKKMSVIDILDDLKTTESSTLPTTTTRTVSGLAVACPRPPPLASTRPASAPAQAKENDIKVVRKVSNNFSSSETARVSDMATSPAERQDLINKIGKRIRFRKKKKEKLKTENRAKKALKTISLILGAFVTCWTPYHILAIIASFCPTCVNIHIYMLSYFLCYANRSVPTLYTRSSSRLLQLELGEGDLSTIRRQNVFLLIYDPQSPLSVSRLS